MNIITILLFFVYTWGLGFSVNFFAKQSSNFLERNIMRVGIGLSVLIVLGIILDFFKIILDWRIFLFLSLIVPIIYFIKNYKNFSFSFKFRLTKSNLAIFIVFILFFVTLFMYSSGAFKYEYLENDDPWGHAVISKYISVEKNLSPGDKASRFLYLDPYPPGYDFTMGLLHQTSQESLSWTLKFFNALIISLGIFFFYFFANKFIKNRNKALFATFVFASIPCYLSHFIWAHAFIPTLLFPALYALLNVNGDYKWIWPAVVSIAVFPLIQPTQAIKAGIIIGLFMLIKSIYNPNKIKSYLIIIVSSISLSLFWWGKMLFRYGGLKNILVAMGMASASSGDLLTRSGNLFKISGTATRIYSFNDFFVAKSANMINNPIGVGIFISIILFISLIVILIKFKSIIKKENYWF